MSKTGLTQKTTWSTNQLHWLCRKEEWARMGEEKRAISGAASTGTSSHVPTVSSGWQSGAQAGDSL